MGHFGLGVLTAVGDENHGRHQVSTYHPEILPRWSLRLHPLATAYDTLALSGSGYSVRHTLGDPGAPDRDAGDHFEPTGMGAVPEPPGEHREPEHLGVGQGADDVHPGRPPANPGGRGWSHEGCDWSLRCSRSAPRSRPASGPPPRPG